MTSDKYMCLRNYDGSPDTAYLELQDHPHETKYGIVARAVDIHGLIEGYDGPRLVLEFDKLNRPIGIEIIYPSRHEDDENG
ncbi:MAG TPA: DUF2283 domain-containing protein [Pirellulales bacterium]|jgi:hypothetical protein|nr:DUF2283 domain-containing protein [Pirellulales bacterium]